MTVVVGGVDQLVVDMPGVEPVLRPGGLPVDDRAAAQLPVGVVGEAGGVGAVAVLPGVRAQPALGVAGLVCYQSCYCCVTLYSKLPQGEPTLLSSA